MNGGGRRVSGEAQMRGVIPCLPKFLGPEQGIKLLGLLLTGSTGQHMASQNGLA